MKKAKKVRTLSLDDFDRLVVAIQELPDFLLPTLLPELMFTTNPHVSW
jgi:hypothetical protein